MLKAGIISRLFVFVLLIMATRALAIHALHIPTTRSLAMISLPSVPVAREKIESACVVARVAPSFLRIGSFEAFNPPPSTVMYLFNPAATSRKEQDLEGLRVLGEWVMRRVLRIESKPDEPWGKALVLAVAKRNAVMVAGWQAYGFMVRGLASYWETRC